MKLYASQTNADIYKFHRYALPRCVQLKDAEYCRRESLLSIIKALPPAAVGFWTGIEPEKYVLSITAQSIKTQRDITRPVRCHSEASSRIHDFLDLLPGQCRTFLDGRWVPA